MFLQKKEDTVIYSPLFLKNDVVTPPDSIDFHCMDIFHNIFFFVFCRRKHTVSHEFKKT